MDDSPALFSIQDLHAESQDGHPILKGVNLDIREGEVHALMGPNGSGKSTLATVLLGNADYKVTSGKVLLRGEDITDWSPEDRGKAGIFLAFQYPQTLSGVTISNLLRQALDARKQEEQSVLEVRSNTMKWLERLNMDPTFADRFVNEGFSGGEKKRSEILQMAMLEPEMAILDETDSGLDIDALKITAGGIQEVRRVRENMGVLVITHFRRLLDSLMPDHVHILIHGEIRASGDMELVKELEAKGYETWLGDFEKNGVVATKAGSESK